MDKKTKNQALEPCTSETLRKFFDTMIADVRTGNGGKDKALDFYTENPIILDFTADLAHKLGTFTPKECASMKEMNEKDIER